MRLTATFGLLSIALCALILSAADPPKKAELPEKTEPPDNRKLTLRFETDRTRYDKDDTIMVLALFKGSPLAKIQLDTHGGGSMYFHLFLEPVGRKDVAFCVPVWKLQFINYGTCGAGGWGSTAWLQSLPVTYHQFCIHLPRLSRLPEGDYKMRLGYTRRHGEELADLAEKALGKRVGVDGLGSELLEGGWDGALLSEPAIITIGPAHVAPAPRLVKP